MTKLTTTFLLCASVLFGSAAASGADQLAGMQDELAMRVSLVKRFHQKYSRSLVTAAQDQVFKKYFLARTEDEKEKLKRKIDQLSLAVQAEFKVDEMCLIDRKGQEISRIVYRAIAPDKDLSSEEASAAFFKPSFAKDGKRVHVSPPYMSADSLRWVVCYATPIVLEDGTKPGIYHYETPLYALQKRANKRLEKDQDHYFLLVNKDGYVMSDSRKKFKLELDPADTEMNVPYSYYFPHLKDSDLRGLSSDILKGGEGSSRFEAGGAEYLVAYRPLNYADWTAVLVRKKE